MTRERNIAMYMFLTVCILTFVACVINAEAKPLLIYGEDVNVTRAKSLMSLFPEKCYDKLTLIYFYDNSPNDRYRGYFRYDNSNTKIFVYDFNGRDDWEVYEILSHELGHLNEYREQRISGIRRIVFSESYADSYGCL